MLCNGILTSNRFGEEKLWRSCNPTIIIRRYWRFEVQYQLQTSCRWSERRLMNLLKNGSSCSLKRWHNALFAVLERENFSPFRWFIVTLSIICCCSLAVRNGCRWQILFDNGLIKIFFLRTNCLENFLNNVFIYCVILVFVALAKGHYLLLVTASCANLIFLGIFIVIDVDSLQNR